MMAKKKKKTPLLERAGVTNKEAIEVGKKVHQAILEGTITKDDIKQAWDFEGVKGRLVEGPYLEETQYIKIPLVGSRNADDLANNLSDLLCWFRGVEFMTPKSKSSQLDMARNGIRAIQDIMPYIKKLMK